MSGYKLPSGQRYTASQMLESAAINLAEAVDRGADEGVVAAHLASYRRWKAQHEAEMVALDAWLAVRPHELI